MQQGIVSAGDQYETPSVFLMLMPELPEVETVRRSLERSLVNLAVASVSIRRPDIITGKQTPRALLSGARLTDFRRHGKQLAITADNGRTLCVHLGMTGQLIHLAAGDRAPRPDHIHMIWRLSQPGAARSSAGRLIFRDPRRFGGIWTFDSLDELLETRWSKLGPDAARITAPQLRSRLAHANRPLKAALLDQTLIAGLGNIYVDEALHSARLAPQTPARDFITHDPDAPVLLARAIRATLAHALKAGGSTIRDYTSADGEEGSFQTQHAVYGRGEAPCFSCATPLVKTTIAQRTTVYCPICQPGG